MKYQRYFKCWENQVQHEICFFFPAEEGHKFLLIIKSLSRGINSKKKGIVFCD